MLRSRVIALYAGIVCASALAAAGAVAAPQFSAEDYVPSETPLVRTRSAEPPTKNAPLPIRKPAHAAPAPAAPAPAKETVGLPVRKPAREGVPAPAEKSAPTPAAPQASDDAARKAERVPAKPVPPQAAEPAASKPVQAAVTLPERKPARTHALRKRTARDANLPWLKPRPPERKKSPEPPKRKPEAALKKAPDVPVRKPDALRQKAPGTPASRPDAAKAPDAAARTAPPAPEKKPDTHPEKAAEKKAPEAAEQTPPEAAPAPKKKAPPGDGRTREEEGAKAPSARDRHKVVEAPGRSPERADTHPPGSRPAVNRARKKDDKPLPRKPDKTAHKSDAKPLPQKKPSTRKQKKPPAPRRAMTREQQCAALTICRDAFAKCRFANQEKGPDGWEIHKKKCGDAYNECIRERFGEGQMLFTRWFLPFNPCK